MTTEDNFETLFQTYTRDKIDEIVGGVRDTAASNTESLRTLQAQSEENLKKTVSLQTQALETKESIQGLQNRLSENRTQVNNLIESTKADLEKKSSDLATRVGTFESSPAPKSGVDLPERLDRDKKLYQFTARNYKITVYHIVGPIYYVYVNIAISVFGTNSMSTDIQISQEIADLKLYFAPQKLFSSPGNDAPSISSTTPGISTFYLEKSRGVGDVGVGDAGFYAISVTGADFPQITWEHL
jgi:hypothetical protein|nr:MAG TPA: hypothetical protein [Caudoviricetes sp.]